MTATEATPELDIETKDDRAFLGHPKGLGYLAFTEAWERFSFYGMRALLSLYMVNFLFKPEELDKVAGIETLRKLFGGLQGESFALAIAGAYAAGVYLTPIFGGLLADQVLGKRRTVLLGAITMAIGHFLMAFNLTFVLALICLILGSGMFKGNISSQVGSLYKPEDLRRADAFQIFYLGINAGVIASPLVIGTLGEKVGWHWGFGAAGIGMLIALVIYISGQKYLPKEHFDIPGRSAAEKPKAEPMNRRDWLAVLAALLLIPVLAIGQVPNDQIFGAYIVWADQQFDLVFFGTKLPTTWLVTLDAIVSVSFLAGVALFYRWYGKRWNEPDELSKIIIGSAISVLGMGCLYMAALTQPEGGKIGLFWPVMFHVVNSIAFAHILPVSLALYARLAPKQLNSTVIAFYFIGFFVDQSITGYVGSEYFGKIPVTSFWAMHMGFSAVSGVVLLLFKLFLAKPLMGSGKAEDLALA